MNEEIFLKLKQFVFAQGFGYKLGVTFFFKKKEITRETAIEKDLKIMGDDADEFLVDFGKEFNVDISKFKIDDYFGDEGDPILPAIIRVITGRKKKAKEDANNRTS